MITANATPLDGKLLSLKTSLEGVLDNDDKSNVQHVLVFKRTDDEVPMKPERDEWLEEVYSYIAKYSVYICIPIIHALFGSSMMHKGAMYTRTVTMPMLCLNVICWFGTVIMIESFIAMYMYLWETSQFSDGVNPCGTDQ